MKIPEEISKTRMSTLWVASGKTAQPGLVVTWQWGLTGSGPGFPLGLREAPNTASCIFYTSMHLLCGSAADSELETSAPNLVASGDRCLL